MIRSSIKQALSTKSADVKIVESFTATEFKTKNVVALLEKIGVEGSILIVAGKAEPKFIASARNIAGILSEKRNVLGLMPHPERVVDEVLGGTDGRNLFHSLIETLS